MVLAPGTLQGKSSGAKQAIASMERAARTHRRAILFEGALTDEQQSVRLDHAVVVTN